MPGPDRTQLAPLIKESRAELQLLAGERPDLIAQLERLERALQSEQDTPEAVKATAEALTSFLAFRVEKGARATYEGLRATHSLIMELQNYLIALQNRSKRPSDGSRTTE